MRESNFIKQNKEKWEEFEKILEKEQKNPDKLKELFVQITDDLSYSRTFYPNRSVRVYLNGLAQNIFHSIYKTRKEGTSRFWTFWTDELPIIVYQSRKAFLLSLVVFLGAFLIGALSCMMDPEFPRVILGDEYVNMTIENIESGDPMAVYKQKGQYGMSMGITFNNLYVAFLTFVMGIIYSIGSIAILISNGIMVGAFQYFFYEQGVFLESFLTIWIHGTLEISAIIIAGAAGITLGSGMVFPGTYTRVQAFQISAKRGLKIMLGITPIFILAGFIEGFLTRLTDTPDIIRALFIFLCLAFVIFYFIWYPQHKAKSGSEYLNKSNEIPADKNQVINFQSIKTSGEIIPDVFKFYKNHFRKLASISFVLSGLFCLFTYVLYDGEDTLLFERTEYLFIFNAIANVDKFFSYEEFIYLPIINTILITIFTFVVYQHLLKDAQNSFESADYIERSTLFKIINTIIPIAVMMVCFQAGGVWFFLFIVGLFPLLLLWIYLIYAEGNNCFEALGNTFRLIGAGYSVGITTTVGLLSLAMLFYSIADSAIFWFYIDILSWNLSLDPMQLELVVAVLLTFTSMWMLYMLYGFFLTGIGLLYYSILEQTEAYSLRKMLTRIGIQNKIQGIEKEV